MIQNFEIHCKHAEFNLVSLHFVVKTCTTILINILMSKEYYVRSFALDFFFNKSHSLSRQLWIFSRKEIKSE
jgi:hypothetical protein